MPDTPTPGGSSADPPWRGEYAPYPREKRTSTESDPELSQDYGSGTDPQMVIDAVELGRRQGSREAQVEAKVDKQLEMVRHKEGGPMGSPTGGPYDWAQEESGQRSHPLTRMQRFNAWRHR